MSQSRKTPKELVNDSGNDFKDSGNHLLKSTGKIITGSYNLVDAIDKTIGSIGPQVTNRIVDFTKNNLIKILIVGGLLGYTGKKVYDAFPKDKQENTIELSSGTQYIDFETDQKNTYWNNPNFFDTTFFKKGNTIETLDDNVYISHDGGGYFYLMLPEDVKKDRITTINNLRNKLSKYKQFAYLSSPHYAPQYNKSNNSWAFTNTFNIRNDYVSLAKNSSLQSNKFWVPIPLDKEVRMISNKEFYTAATNALELLPTYNQTYGEIIGMITQKIDKKKLSELLTVVALLETGRTNTTIGHDEYHRREEGSHKCFSFGPQHILMSGPGLVARKQLQLSEGQIYHPINSNIVVLGFMIEKIIDTFYAPKDRPDIATLTDTKKKRIADDLYKKLSFLNSSLSKKSITTFCEFYNGRNYKNNNYDGKLIKAFAYLEVSLSSTTILGNTQKTSVQEDTQTLAPIKPEPEIQKTPISSGDHTITRDGFDFLRLSTNNEGKKYYIYKYTIKKSGTPKIVKDKFIQSFPRFAKNEMTITDKLGTIYTSNQKFVEGSSIYIKVKMK